MSGPERSNKFEWLRAVYRERRFSAGEKAVLAHVAVFNVLSGADSFQVRQETIAGQCGISRVTVGGAFRLAKQLGYLVVSRRRATGYGRNGADELRLSLPAVSKLVLRDSEDGPSDVKETAESCKENGPSDVKETAESCKAANTSTCGNDTPTSSLNQFSEASSGGEGERAHEESPTPEPDPPRDDAPTPGLLLDENNNPAPAAPGPDYDWFLYPDDDPDGAPADDGTTAAPVIDAEVVDEASGQQVSDDPDPEPQRYCNGHMPDGTDDDCGACGRRRRIHEAWECRNPDRVMGRTAAKVAGWVATGGTASPQPQAAPRPKYACSWCHDTGLVLMSDGNPGSTPSACNHDGSRRPATPEEVADYERRRRSA